MTWPSASLTTTLTSNSILKLREVIVGHVKSRGKNMWIGNTHWSPWQTSPLAICMLCISVASRAIPSAQPETMAESQDRIDDRIRTQCTYHKFRYG